MKTTREQRDAGGQAKALNPSLAKRLLAYASFAGAGAMCAPHQMQAEIVYTPVHSNIGFDYALDLNQDGTLDFRIRSSYISGFASVSVKPIANGNRVAGTSKKPCFPNRLRNAAPLPAGAAIGPDTPMNRASTCLINGYSGKYGPWVGVQDHYLGLAFVINGKIHFGWARLSVNNFFCLGCLARIEGYAYETEPGKAIRAGDEGGLGTLAVGAPGVRR
ncbi:MAG TPA: hypothetical protein VND65_11350 [Candidatus Binatia bacterium]|nr:hypothetical protein [Candidatus Binatia bacterium]